VSNLNQITERIIERLGLTEMPGGKVFAPDSQAWDCSLGALTFLFAMSDQNPMLRETADFRRERIDTERTPGEQSLDSGFWYRSQESWHLGAGLRSAEPLELDTSESRFRYARGGGVDPWTPGQLTLLNETESVRSLASTYIEVLGTSAGVLVANDSGVEMTDLDGLVLWSYSNANIHSLTTDGDNWYIGTTGGEIYSGTNAAGGGTLYHTFTTTENVLVRWVKGRLIATVGREVHEGAGGTWTQIDPGTTFPSGWNWVDIAEGPSAIYLAGNAGDQAAIYKIEATATTSAIQLSALVQVADMPRGETVNTIYAYVGSFLMIGTSTGTRVASINDDGNLSIGPLIHESSDGVKDFVAVGSYVYAAVGAQCQKGDRSTAPGLVRIHLGETLNNSPLDFAYADDIYVDVTGSCESVTYASDKLILGVTGTAGVYKQAATYVESGWVETGRIRLGTAEAKTWRDLRVLNLPGSSGSVIGYANRDEGSTNPSTWQQVVFTDGERYDRTGKVSSNPNEPFTDIFVALELKASTDKSGTSHVSSYNLRAIPAPTRTRLIRVPVLLFDRETDRAGSVMGYDGYAFDRLELLEALEQVFAVVPFEDFTTGEKVNVYIERVSYSRTTPPAQNDGNNGGIATILLRVI
jgi:hypothetical protein